MKHHHVLLVSIATVLVFDIFRPSAARANLPFIGRMPSSPIAGPATPGLLEGLLGTTTPSA